MRAIFVAILILITGSAHAVPVVIDFEEYADTGAAPVSFLSKGYRFTQTSGFTGVLASVTNGYDTSFFFCPEPGCNNGQNPSFRMESVNGALFNLTAMDIGWLEGTSHPARISGRYADGSSITLQLNALGDWYDTITFGESWNSLESVSVRFEIEDNRLFNVPGVDNIVVSAVPIPAAVWLFGSALAGLGWMRKIA